jgi:hypothetical protein
MVAMSAGEEVGTVGALQAAVIASSPAASGQAILWGMAESSSLAQKYTVSPRLFLSWTLQCRGANCRLPLAPAQQ